LTLKIRVQREKSLIFQRSDHTQGRSHTAWKQNPTITIVFHESTASHTEILTPPSIATGLKNAPFFGVPDCLNGWRVASCGRTGDGRFEADSAAFCFIMGRLTYHETVRVKYFWYSRSFGYRKCPFRANFMNRLSTSPNGRNQSQRPIDPKAISFGNCLQLG
jgi:hypothetical protein